jgi:uncharacterized protein YcfJ
MVGLALILGIVVGSVIGYLIGYQKGFGKGKAYVIQRKRWYEKTRK